MSYLNIHTPIGIYKFNCPLLIKCFQLNISGQGKGVFSLTTSWSSLICLSSSSSLPRSPSPASTPLEGLLLLVHFWIRCLLANLITSGLFSKHSCSPYCLHKEVQAPWRGTQDSFNWLILTVPRKPSYCTRQLKWIQLQALLYHRPEPPGKLLSPLMPVWNTTVKLKQSLQPPTTLHKHTCIYQEDTSTLKHLI